MRLEKLCEQEVITAKDLIATLKEYAEAGECINGEKVLEIFKKISPTKSELVELRRYSLLGITIQAKINDSLSSRYCTALVYSSLLRKFSGYED